MEHREEISGRFHKGERSAITDQRFYASSLGRFNTADPQQSSAKPNNPSSWNRFAYVGGDPVNLLDPRGLEQVDCGDAWMSDSSLSGPCCLPGNHFLPDPNIDPACYTSGGGAGTSGDVEPTRTKCDIDFGFAPVAKVGKHTFLELTQTYSDGSTTVDYIEAANTDGNSPFAPPGTNKKAGYLNLWDTTTGVYSSEKKYTVTQTAADLGLSGGTICADVDKIFDRAAQYIKNVNWKIQYHWYGTNSNSFIHWILDGVPGLGFSPPSGAVGWNNDGNIDKYIP